ncbi:hypothetical protein [Nordella sp. HKS 07]
MVESAVPMTNAEIGKVAQALDGAICTPMRPAVVNMITVAEP